GQRIFPAIAAARLTAEWPMRFDRRLAAAGLVPPLCRSAAPLTAGLSSRGAARSVLRGPVLRCNAVVRRAVFRRAVFRRAVVRGPSLEGGAARRRCLGEPVARREGSRYRRLTIRSAGAARAPIPRPPWREPRHHE